MHDWKSSQRKCHEVVQKLLLVEKKYRCELYLCKITHNWKKAQRGSCWKRSYNHLEGSPLPLMERSLERAVFIGSYLLDVDTFWHISSWCASFFFFFFQNCLMKEKKSMGRKPFFCECCAMEYYPEFIMLILNNFGVTKGLKSSGRLCVG